MNQITLAAALALVPLMASGQTANPTVQDILEGHILPNVESLSTATQALSDAAIQDCTPTSPQLRKAYSTAFDAWVSASHLRFGPTEVADRSYALAFWPDSRGATPRALTTMISQNDPIASAPDKYSEVSIAARGFYAMEFLLYDAGLQTVGDPAYRCELLQTIAADAATMTRAISNDWREDYAPHLLTPSVDGPYRSNDEVLKELLKALSTGLEFTAETRLGRPLGTFDKPRPTRAEAWRSGRSAAHVALSLIALQDLADRLTGDDDPLKADLNALFERTQTQLAALNDPVFAGVSDPQTRLKIEVVQQSVQSIRDLVRARLGPKLGVAAGFNSMDGD